MKNKETAMIIVLVILLVAVGGFTMMNKNSGGLFGCGYGNGSYTGYGMMSGYGGIFGIIMMILVMLVLVLFILWLVKQLTDNAERIFDSRGAQEPKSTENFSQKVLDKRRRK